MRESRFTAKPGDYFVIVSDARDAAGMGETLAFGWGCEEVAEFLCGPCGEKLSAPRVIERVLGVAEDLYLGKPGDDTTVSIAHIMTPQTVSLFSGRPKNPEDDSRLVRRIHGDARAARPSRRHQLRNPSRASSSARCASTSTTPMRTSRRRLR